MEIFKGSITDRLRNTNLLRKGALIGSALVLVAACNIGDENYPGEKVLREELGAGQTSDGRIIANFRVQGSNSQEKEDIINNGGLNVRVSSKEGQDLSSRNPFYDTSIVAVLPTGAEITGAEEFFTVKRGQAIAFDCEQINQYLSSATYAERLCYILDADKYLQSYAGSGSPTPTQ